MPTARFCVIVISTSFAVFYVCSQLILINEQTVNQDLMQHVFENVAKDSRYSAVYRKPTKLPKEVKYMLLWTQNDYAPFHYFKTGQWAFIDNNCSVIDCYVTNDRNFFGGDVTKFDAIAFNGRNLKRNDLPSHRSPRQKYIFFNMESSENYPICNYYFDEFFNWTSTYRLDSDIPYAYILIRDKKGEVVGPKTEMHWPDSFPDVDNDKFIKRLKKKTKAAAWFVSHCTTKSGREKLVENLQQILDVYGLKIDVYGSCGTLECSRSEETGCGTLLQQDYYFYLAFENSIAEDYVTEKLLKALQHETVPIVYGGANYSRFLPPGSYIDASKFNAYDLAAIIDRLMKVPNFYKQFFKWKSKYTYSDPTKKENVCAVCAALNNKKLMEEVTVYKKFRKWWNPNYYRRCG